jgi:hypothetical protein
MKTGTSQLDEQQESRKKGHEYLLAGVALVAELLAVVYGEQWLGWIAAFFFTFAFYHYTKLYFEKHGLVAQYGTCVLFLLVLLVSMWFSVSKIERHIRARLTTVPNLQIALNEKEILILDNTKGSSDLRDFRVTAVEYYLDLQSIVHQQVKIISRNPIGGDLDFEHFDVKAGEVKEIDLNQGRYGDIRVYLRKQPEIADVQVHYLCLRLVFTSEDTGETFVHYVVVSPYNDGLAWGERPDRVGAGQAEGNSEGFPYNIPRTIKADARSFYGTEFREYKP